MLVDGAQGVPHLNVDVQALGCDFYAFSGHKMFGPTGTGVLYGREELLEAMPPWQGGGDMILEVSFDETIYNELPYKFEAGTPNISGVIGLGAAIDYLQAIGMANIASYEHELHDYMVAELKKVDGIRLIGEARHKASAQSFLLDDIHSHDLGTILDHQGVAIRTGHHCAMPRHAALRHLRERRAHRSPSTTTATMSIGLSPRSVRPKRFSDERAAARDMQDLYRELILDHSRNPRHFGRLEDATHTADGINPLVRRQAEALPAGQRSREIESSSFEGTGCAISVASASLLTDTVTGCRSNRPSRARLR